MDVLAPYVGLRAAGPVRVHRMQPFGRKLLAIVDRRREQPLSASPSFLRVGGRSSSKVDRSFAEETATGCFGGR